MCPNSCAGSHLCFPHCFFLLVSELTTCLFLAHTGVAHLILMLSFCPLLVVLLTRHLTDVPSSENLSISLSIWTQLTKRSGHIRQTAKFSLQIFFLTSVSFSLHFLLTYHKQPLTRTSDKLASNIKHPSL